MSIEEAFQGLVYGGCCDGEPGHAEDTANRADKARALALAVLEEAKALVAPREWNLDSDGLMVTKTGFFTSDWLELRARIAALGESGDAT